MVEENCQFETECHSNLITGACLEVKRTRLERGHDCIKLGRRTACRAQRMSRAGKTDPYLTTCPSHDNSTVLLANDFCDSVWLGYIFVPFNIA